MTERQKTYNMKRIFSAAMASLAVAMAASAQDRLLVVAGINGESSVVTNPERVTFVERGDPNDGWTSLGYCLYGEDFIGSTMFFDRYGDMCCDYYVEVQEKDDTPGLYRLVDPYSPDTYPYGEYCALDSLEDHYYLVIDATDPKCVSIDMQDMGVSVTYPGAWSFTLGRLYVWDYAGYFLSMGTSKEECKEYGYYGTMEDGVITYQRDRLISAWNGSMYMDANEYGNFKVDLNDRSEKAGAGAPVNPGMRGRRPNVNTTNTVNAATIRKDMRTRDAR